MVNSLKRGKNIGPLIAFIIVVLVNVPIKASDAQKIYKIDGFDYIAYSSVGGIGDAPINSAEHFLHCCSPEYSFDTIKGDIRVTSDNGLVMCHDQGFTFNDDGKIINYDSSNMTDIHDMTLKECLNLKYAKKYRGQDVSICDFELYIKICAENKKKAFITIRDDYIPELLDVMMPLIYKYDMADHCIINSFNYNSLLLVHQYNSDIKLSWVFRHGTVTNDKVDKAKTLGNCIISFFEFPTSTHGGLESIENQKDVIQYALDQGLSMYAATVEDASFVKTLIGYGFSGAQMVVSPGEVLHDWGEPTYLWSEDLKSVTASRVCKYDDTHIETETVSIEKKTIEEQSYFKDGVIQYESDVFSNKAFEKQEKEIIIPAALPNEVLVDNAFYRIDNKGYATFLYAVDGVNSYFSIPSYINVSGYSIKVTSIAANAFKNNKNIEKISIGKTIKNIGKYAFYGCDNLQTIIGGKNISKIGKGAFAKCSNLNTVLIGTKVKQIGGRAFYKCKNLTEIVIKSEKLNESNIGANAFEGISKKVDLICTDYKYEEYKELLINKGIKPDSVF